MLEQPQARRAVQAFFGQYLDLNRLREVERDPVSYPGFTGTMPASMRKELDELFAHRDFLKGEGDRFHKEFVAGKQKADEVHTKITELMKEVNEARDKLKIAREERANRKSLRIWRRDVGTFAHFVSL